MTYTVDNVTCDECPRSFITGESQRLVTEINAAAWVKEATGAYPGGTDCGEWDARYFDAVRLIEIEKTRRENAEREAVS